MAISKVILNGVTQMDVTDTTATAEDVASGKVFYMASGLRTVGTASCGLTDDVKTALLNCFEHVAWIDDQGQTYYDELYSALHDGLASISAVYTQTGTVYNTDSLDVLRSDLVVIATYGDGTTRTVTAYTLSGTLVVGTSTIAATYSGLTDTFSVTVSANVIESITATFTQSGNVFTSSDLLDDLKPFLAVTAHYSNGDTEAVSNYTLSGNLNSATSIITVTYEGLTTTFSVSVAMLPSGYTAKSYVEANGTQYIQTSISETYMEGKGIRYKEQVTQLAERAGHVFSSTDYYAPYARYFPSASIQQYSLGYNRYGNQTLNNRNTDNLWQTNTDIVIECYRNNDDITLNGVYMGSLSSGSTKSSSNLFTFFRAGSNTNTVYYLRGKLFWFKVYNGNTKTNDFVPCINASNVVGLYDLVTGIFYPPSEGTLTAD